MHRKDDRYTVFESAVRFSLLLPTRILYTNLFGCLVLSCLKKSISERFVVGGNIV